MVDAREQVVRGGACVGTWSFACGLGPWRNLLQLLSAMSYAGRKKLRRDAAWVGRAFGSSWRLLRAVIRFPSDELVGWGTATNAPEHGHSWFQMSQP